MTLSLIFLILALIAFLCATANMPSRINLTALGLAFLVMSMLVGQVVIRG